MRVLVVSANREVMPQAVVPLGAISVAAAAREAHEVAMVDLCFEDDPLEAVARAVEEVRPDVVGVGLRNLRLGTYAESDDLLGYYRDVVRAVRASTRAPVVLGGAGFSLRPQTLLDELGADHGVVGEGERAFRGLCDDLEAGRTPPRLVSTATYSGADTLDDLPRPARDLVDPRYYVRDGTDNVQTKRGCCFECAYCDYPDIEGRRFRLRDPARVAAEAAERAQAPGVSHLFFVDSVFNLPHAHAMTVCRELARTGVPMKWVAYVTPVGFDDALARAMAEAGCVGIEIGADSGDDAGLARLNKPFKVADIREAHALCVRHGLRDCHTFVLGVGDEGEEDVKQTLAFVDDLDPDVAVFVVFVEDREDRAIERARHRDAILRLLAAEAPKRKGWVVPELSIRFGDKVARLAARRRFRGPAWLALAERTR